MARGKLPALRATDSVSAQCLLDARSLGDSALVGASILFALPAKALTAAVPINERSTTDSDSAVGKKMDMGRDNLGWTDVDSDEFAAVLDPQRCSILGQFRPCSATHLGVWWFVIRFFYVGFVRNSQITEAEG